MALTLAQAKTLTPEQQERVLKLSKAGGKNAAAQAQSLAQSLYDMNANNVTTQNNPVKPSTKTTQPKAPAKTTVVPPPVAAQSTNTVTPVKPIPTVNNTATPNTVNKTPYLVKAPVVKTPVKPTTTPNPLGKNGEATVINSFDNPTTPSIQETPVSSNAATPSVVKLGTASNTTAPTFKSNTAFTPEIITYLKSKGLSQGQIVVASNVNLNQGASSAIETIKKFADMNKGTPTTPVTNGKTQLSDEQINVLKTKGGFSQAEINQITSYNNLYGPEATRKHITDMYAKKKVPKENKVLDPNIGKTTPPDTSNMEYQLGSNKPVDTAVDQALDTAGVGGQSRTNVEQKIDTSNAEFDAKIGTVTEINKVYKDLFDKMNAEGKASYAESDKLLREMHDKYISGAEASITERRGIAARQETDLKTIQNQREASARHRMGLAGLSPEAMQGMIYSIKTDPVVQGEFTKIRLDLLNDLDKTRTAIDIANTAFLNSKMTNDKATQTYNESMLAKRIELDKQINELKTGKITAVFDVLRQFQNPIIEDIVTNTKGIVGKKEDQDNYERADSNLRKGLLKNALFNISPSFDMAKLTIEDMNNAAAMESIMDAIVFLASRANDKDLNEKLALQNAASSGAGGGKVPGTAGDDLNKKIADKYGKNNELALAFFNKLGRWPDANELKIYASATGAEFHSDPVPTNVTGSTTAEPPKVETPKVETPKIETPKNPGTDLGNIANNVTNNFLGKTGDALEAAGTAIVNAPFNGDLGQKIEDTATNLADATLFNGELGDSVADHLDELLLPNRLSTRRALIADAEKKINDEWKRNGGTGYINLNPLTVKLSDGSDLNTKNPIVGTIAQKIRDLTKGNGNLEMLKYFTVDKDGNYHIIPAYIPDDAKRAAAIKADIERRAIQRKDEAQQKFVNTGTLLFDLEDGKLGNTTDNKENLDKSKQVILGLTTKGQAQMKDVVNEIVQMTWSPDEERASMPSDFRYVVDKILKTKVLKEGGVPYNKGVPLNDADYINAVNYLVQRQLKNNVQRWNQKANMSNQS